MKAKLSVLWLILPILSGGPVMKEYKADLVRSECVFQDVPFKACHASTIAELSGNTFIASWFGGSYEGASDVGIWTSSWKDGSWSTPKEVATSRLNDTLRLPCWNPVLFKSKQGKLFLFYKQGKSPREWWGLVKTSSDEGLTWSAAQTLPQGFLGPIKNKPVQLSTGEILCPSSTESADQKAWRVHLEITDEALSRWTMVKPDTTTFGLIQPSILFYPGNKLQMLCRSRENNVVQTWSTDNGRHWGEFTKTSLPNPNSGIDAVTLTNGLQVIVYNPLLKGTEWFKGRNILNVAVSTDGMNWQDVYVLENQKEGEFSYPAIIQSSDGLVHITYTADRKNIKHVVLKIRAIN